MGRLASGRVPQLIGGLTQLADELTVDGQLRVAKNCRFTLSEGLGRRYPTTLLSSDFGVKKGTKVHTFQHGGDTFALTFDTAGDARLFNIETQVEYPVTSESKAYITGGDLEVFECTDGAFILNRGVSVSTLPYKEPEGPPPSEGKIRTTYTFKGGGGTSMQLKCYIGNDLFTTLNWGENKWYNHEYAANEMQKLIGRGDVVVLSPDSTHGSSQLVIEHTETDRPPRFTKVTLNEVISGGAYGGTYYKPIDVARGFVFNTSDALMLEEPDAIAWVTVADNNASYRLFWGPNSTDYVEYKSPGPGTNAENTITAELVLVELLNKLSACGPNASTPEEKKHSWHGELSPWGYLCLYNPDDPNAFLSYASDLTGQGQSTRDGAMYVIKRTVDRPEMLPPRAPEGYTVNVKGVYSDSEENSGYWLRYVTDAHETQGAWKETHAPNIVTELDGTTMPHILKIAEGRATIGTTPWEAREEGDDISNGLPEFVGKTIKALTSYRNRLALITKDSISMSEAGEWGNFFRTTVLTQKASDRIDFNLDVLESYDIRRATSSEHGIILWDGNNRQFIMTAGDGALTPASFRVQLLSELPVNMNVPPVNISNMFRYLETSSGSSKLRAVVLGQAPMDYCMAVPTLIPKGVTAMACSDYHGMTVLSDGSKDVYVCTSVSVSGQDLMFAWGTWEMPKGITYVAFTKDNELLLFTEDSVLKMVMTLQDEFWNGETTVIADERRTALGRVMGTPYTTEWQPVSMTQKHAQGIGRHLKLRRISIEYKDTTQFDAIVSRKGREDSTVSMTGRSLGALDNVLGEVPRTSGALSVPIMADPNNHSVLVRVEGTYDAIFQAINWEGFMNQRSLRW